MVRHLSLTLLCFSLSLQAEVPATSFENVRLFKTKANRAEILQKLEKAAPEIALQMKKDKSRRDATMNMKDIANNPFSFPLSEKFAEVVAGILLIEDVTSAEKNAAASTLLVLVKASTPINEAKSALLEELRRVSRLKGAEQSDKSYRSTLVELLGRDAKSADGTRIHE